MRVRIQLGAGPHIHRKVGKNRRVALALAALLTPGALMACVLALWRLAADLRWTSDFAISSGLFSHWLVWIGVAVILQFLAIRLNRYGHGDGAVAAGPRNKVARIGGRSG